METGLATYFETVGQCMEHVKKVNDQTTTPLKIKTFSSGYRPSAPRDTAYICLGAFRQKVSGAEKVRKGDFPMQLDLETAKVLARECYAEQRAKYWRRQATKKELDEAEKREQELRQQARKRELDGSTSQSAGTATTGPSVTATSSVTPELPGTAGSDADELSADSKEESEEPNAKRSRTRGASPKATSTLDPPLPASSVTDQSSVASHPINAAQEADPQPAIPLSPVIVPSNPNESSRDSPQIKVRESSSPEVDLLPMQDSTKPLAQQDRSPTAPAAQQQSNSLSKVDDENNDIPLPKRLRRRLGTLGYYTMQQLKDSGLRICFNDLVRLAGVIHALDELDMDVNKSAAMQFEGLDPVEDLAMRLRLEETRTAKQDVGHYLLDDLAIDALPVAFLDGNQIHCSFPQNAV